MLFSIGPDSPDIITPLISHAWTSISSTRIRPQFFIRLTIAGKVLVLKSGILPGLLYLARVFPLPLRLRRELVRMVFDFIWGGRYQYVSRVDMYRPVSEGGRDVPHFPLKLDCLFYVNLCVGLRSEVVHPCQHFISLWFSWARRDLVPGWSCSVPRAEMLPLHYKQAVWWGKKLPSDVGREALLDHRRLYSFVTGCALGGLLLGWRMGCGVGCSLKS